MRGESAGIINLFPLFKVYGEDAVEDSLKARKTKGTVPCVLIWLTDKSELPIQASVALYLKKRVSRIRHN